MEKEFIPYEQALALKELGFDEPCMMNHYGNDRLHVGRLYLPSSFGKGKNSEMHDDSLRYGDITAILYQQAFRWFREKYEFEFHIGCYRHTSVKYYQVYLDDVLGKHSYSFGKSLTYEEAELECLKKLIEIVKENVDKQR
jgi:hypothetical protein